MSHTSMLRCVDSRVAECYFNTVKPNTLQADGEKETLHSLPLVPSTLDPGLSTAFQRERRTDGRMGGQRSRLDPPLGRMVSGTKKRRRTTRRRSSSGSPESC